MRWQSTVRVLSTGNANPSSVTCQEQPSRGNTIMPMMGSKTNIPRKLPCIKNTIVLDPYHVTISSNRPSAMKVSLKSQVVASEDRRDLALN